MSVTNITATCICQTFHLPLSYPNLELPLPRSLCLCTSCRRVSGTSGGVSYIPLPSSHPSPSTSLKKLTSYKSSERLTRYFCRTCGAHVLLYVHGWDKWAIATGLLDKTEGIVRWAGCQYVQDTLDGGVAPWLRTIVDEGGERKLVSCTGQDAGRSDEVPEAWSALERSGDQDRLRAQCHCGDVKFYVTRPDEQSGKARSAFSDLIVPFHTNASSANPDHEAWFLRCENSKYLAGTCTCVSCRRALGFEVQTWAFIPRSNIFGEDGFPVDFGAGTMRVFGSSEDVERAFCARCGASVFWNAKWRSDLVDVSVGLFDPREGARVERWLDWWTGRVSFEEDAVSTSLVGSLKDGLRKWGEARAQSE